MGFNCVSLFFLTACVETVIIATLPDVQVWLLFTLSTAAALFALTLTRAGCCVYVLQIPLFVVAQIVFVVLIQGTAGVIGAIETATPWVTSTIRLVGQCKKTMNL